VDFANPGEPIALTIVYYDGNSISKSIMPQSEGEDSTQARQDERDTGSIDLEME
jgi:hypothetical protein